MPGRHIAHRNENSVSRVLPGCQGGPISARGPAPLGEGDRLQEKGGEQARVWRAHTEQWVVYHDWGTDVKGGGWRKTDWDNLHPKVWWC